MGEVVFGVDFRARRERERQENEAKVVKALIDILNDETDPVKAHNDMILDRIRGIPANVDLGGFDGAEGYPFAGGPINQTIYESSLGFIAPEHDPA